MKKTIYFILLSILISCNTKSDLNPKSVGIADGSAGGTAPTVSTISPISYGVKGGITVTVTGANFVTGAVVLMGGTNCTNVNVIDPTQLTCKLPYHFASVVDVVVLNPNGISGTLFNGFSYNSYLYAANQSGGSALTRMKIDSASGNVTVLGTTVVPAGAYGVTIDPSNTWIYSASVTANQIAGFTIDHSTGALTAIPGSPFAAGAGVDGVATSRDGKCLIATNFNAPPATAVTSFTINQVTGAITKVADYAGGTNAGFPAVDPLNRFVFVTNNGSANISAYTLNTTNCTLAVVGNYACGASPDAISVHQNGKFVITGNATNSFAGATGGVTVMSVNQTTGALTLVGTFTTSDARLGSGVEIDRTGSQVYVTARGNGLAGQGRIWGFNIDINSGNLSPVNNVITSDGPNDVRVLGSGKFLFSANTESNTINVFNRDLATGNLTPAATPSYTIGNQPGVITITE